MRLHSNVSIQMIKCSVGLLAAIPSALVHALNFFITSPRTLVLLRTGNRDERVNLGERVLYTSQLRFN
jgi:hypothetical protein